MSPKKAYDDQQRHAESRNIPWLFTYAEWLEMWLVSGKWEYRGRGAGKYHMCRFGDEGPYSTTNCYVATMEENQKVTRKYSDKDAVVMWEMYRRGDISQREIGEIFGLHQSTVCKILNQTRRGV
jgi:hypothetical protein